MSITKETKNKQQDNKDLISKSQKCMMCGRILSIKSNFYKSKAMIYQGNNGIMCFCKDCINQQYYEFLTMTRGKEQLAIKFTCAKFSIPFVDSFAIGAIKQSDARKNNQQEDETEVQTKNSYAFMLYMKNLNSLGEKNGITQTDFDYFTNMALTNDEDVSVDIFNDKARNLKVTNEMIEFWDGVKDRKKLYILEKIWNEYANSYKITNPVHVKLFKECAFLELGSIEKRNANVNADVSETTKKITDLLSSLNLLPKNKKSETDSTDSCDGILIKSIENKHPIDDTQWKDKKNFMDCIGYMWRGHVFHNLGEQDNNPQYEKTMKELAVNKNDYVKSNDEDSDNNG